MKNPFRKLGVAGKVALLICALDIFYICSVQILNQHRLSSLLVERELKEMQAQATITSEKLAARIATLGSDITALVGMPPIQGIIRARQAGGIDPVDGSSETEWKKRLETIFKVMQRTKSDYLKISYITPGDDLQFLPEAAQEHSESLFDETSLLAKPNNIRLSDIEFFAKSNENLESPIPVISAVLPVYSASDTLFGFVKIILDLSTEFNELQDSIPNRRSLIIANQTGKPIFYPRSNLTPDETVSEPNHINEIFPHLADEKTELFNGNNTSISSDGNGLRQAVSVQTQNYDPQDPNRLFWLALAAPYQQIVASTVSLRNQSFVYGGMFLSISLILSIFFSRLLTQSLRKITFAVKHFGDTRVPQSLPVNSGDEVGVLARTFEEMFNKIQDSTKRLENEISERKDIEAALGESDEKFRQVIEHSGEVLWMCSANGKKILYISPSYEKIWGHSIRDLFQQERFSLGNIHPEDRDRVHGAFLRKATIGIEYTEEFRIVRPDGGIRWIQDHAFPVRDSHGELKSIAGFAQDISQRKQIESEQRISQKLEAVGQLASGMAHEINTPTQYVGDNTRFLQGAVSELLNVCNALSPLVETADANSISPQLLTELQSAVEAADLEYLREEAPKAVAESLQGIAQIAEMVNAMKEFSHPGGEEFEAADLNKIIEMTITVAKNEWKYVAEVVTDLDDDLAEIHCDPQMIGQVILNLIVNAAHAIKDTMDQNSGQRGTITISTRQINNKVEICIADTGTGIPDSIKEKIFDPFFTTKGIGKGTGQGLSLARSAIVDQHGGYMDVETTHGAGAKFIIGLNLDPEDLREQEDAA